MIELTADPQSLQTTRLAFSPTWEMVGSLGILARYRGLAPFPHTRWAQQVRAGMPSELTVNLVEALKRAELFPPGFLPVPDPNRGTIEAELAHLSRRHAGSAAAHRTIDLLARYWEYAIAPHWASIRSSLDEEILFRGRTLAVGGVEAMLAELGGRVSWTPPYLTAPYHRDVNITLGDARLLLVPTVFAGGMRLFTEEDGMIALSYQARGTGHFQALTATQRATMTEGRLGILLGRGRAQVVYELLEPRTTTAVAISLGMAKSTVSQHLTVLCEADVVRKQRLGGRVLYQLNDAGMALLRDLGPQMASKVSTRTTAP